MIVEFVENYLSLLIDDKDSYNIELQEISENFSHINIYAKEDCIGLIVGKRGMLKNSLKTVINGCKIKNGKAYKINVIQKD
ncbi:MAG: hypothetical protein B1H07_03050 [Campylobacteraceae bacterium 4484_166]|nr:MAG: hypothetical protein B1H07_03050 [Campylobacteraceae bacterium 4484_166]